MNKTVLPAMPKDSTRTSFGPTTKIVTPSFATLLCNCSLRPTMTPLIAGSELLTDSLCRCQQVGVTSMTGTAGQSPTGNKISELASTNQSQHNNFTDSQMSLILETYNVIRVINIIMLDYYMW